MRMCGLSFSGNSLPFSRRLTTGWLTPKRCPSCVPLRCWIRLRNSKHVILKNPLFLRIVYVCPRNPLRYIYSWARNILFWRPDNPENENYLMDRCPERRLGGMLEKMEMNKGGHLFLTSPTIGPVTAPTLQDIEINKIHPPFGKTAPLQAHSAMFASWQYPSIGKIMHKFTVRRWLYGFNSLL